MFPRASSNCEGQKEIAAAYNSFNVCGSEKHDWSSGWGKIPKAKTHLEVCLVSSDICLTHVALFEIVTHISPARVTARVLQRLGTCQKCNGNIA